MTDYSELKRLAEAATPGPWKKTVDGVMPEGRGFGIFGNFGATDGEENRAFIAAANPAAVLALIAEVEALRADLEQVQYDANAWRNGEESVWIEVFNSEDDDPFISAITGQITIEQLDLVQAKILEYREGYFEKGSGLYVFRCAHYQAHYDNVGMTEPAHWETYFESYSPFPWEQDATAMSKESGHD